MNSAADPLASLPLRDNLRGCPVGAGQLQVEVALNTNENAHPVPEHRRGRDHRIV
ncbi:hypothetical protein QJS66_06450 [Kocuria rhizophila]|nr:hypothetical protein QJS66_06450 [Kocuria rhizophila]